MSEAQFEGSKISDAPFGVQIREPFKSELEFFGINTNVAGMATEDGRVVLNPFSALSEIEKRSVVLNESARVIMRTQSVKPKFSLTKKQSEDFKIYGGIQDQRETIAARILSGDPSAGQPTKEQMKFVEKLKKKMGLTN